MRRVKDERVLALGIFSLITLFLTFPVLLHLSSLVNGRPFEDAFESIWYLYWYKHALFDLHVSPLFQPDIFYPLGWDLRLAIFPPLYPFLLSPLTLLVGPVAAYNLTMIGSCIAAAYGMFLLVRSMSGNLWGGLLAGVAFAFYPQREVYLGGHLNFLLGSMWLPWMLYGMVRTVRSAERRTQWAAFTLISYALAVCGAWQFVFIGGVVLLIGILGYWLSAMRYDPKGWSRPLVIGLLAWGLIAGPLLWGALSVRNQIGEAAEFTFEEVDNTSVSIERLVVPSALNPLAWDLARRTFPLVNGQDGVAVLGYIPVLLSLLQLLKSRRFDADHQVGLMLIVTGVLLMLGTTLHFWGKPILLSLSPTTADRLRDIAQKAGLPQITSGQAVRIPGPVLFAYWLIPPFRSFRHFGRWGLVGSVGIGMLAGLGLTRMTDGVKGGLRTVVGGAALLLVVVEFNTQPLLALTSTAQMHRTVDDWLAARPEPGVIIEYPLGYTMHGQSLYYVLAHHQKIVHGYSQVFPAGYPEMLTVLNQWPEPATLDLLERIGVKYILVHSFEGDDFEDKQLPALVSVPRLRLIARFPTPIGRVKDIYLFELKVPSGGSTGASQ